MRGGSRYRPVDRAAYRGRPRLPVSALPGLVILPAFLAVALPRFDGDWWVWLGVLVVSALNLRQVLISLPLPRTSPFVVDAPGVWVGDDGRLVHWESIAEIVLFRSAVGLRLRRHPEVIAIRQVLHSWSLDRARLEAAVARYAPGVRVVDGSGDLDASAGAARGVGAVAGEPLHVTREANEPRDEARVVEARPNREQVTAGPAPEPGNGGQAAPDGVPGRRPVPMHRGRYRATDSRAYVVRPTWGSSPGAYVFPVAGVAAGVAAAASYGSWAAALPFVAVSLMPLALNATAVVRGSIRFAADAPGVFLGDLPNAFFGGVTSGLRPVGYQFVPWAEIAAVVLFDVEGEGTWDRAVGVTWVPAGGGEPVLRYHRVLSGCRLDRVALEAAVLRLAPQVPVVDGPPIRPRRPRPLDRSGAVLERWRRRGERR